MWFVVFVTILRVSVVGSEVTCNCFSVTSLYIWHFHLFLSYLTIIDHLIVLVFCYVFSSVCHTYDLDVYILSSV